MLMGSFGIYVAASKWESREKPMRFFSSSPNTFFWQALNYLHSSLPKLFKYVRSWSNRKAFGAHGRQSFPCGLLGIRHENRGEEQRLVGTVKDAWTIAAHRNSFSETCNEIPADCKNLSNISKVLFCVLENVVSKHGDTRIWSLYFTRSLSFSNTNQ